MAKKTIVPPLSKRQESILKAVKSGKTTLTSICAKLGKDPGHVSRYLKKLKSLGLLETKRDENDYRVTHYSIKKEV